MSKDENPTNSAEPGPGVGLLPSCNDYSIVVMFAFVKHPSLLRKICKVPGKKVLLNVVLRPV